MNSSSQRFFLSPDCFKIKHKIKKTTELARPTIGAKGWNISSHRVDETSDLTGRKGQVTVCDVYVGRRVVFGGRPGAG